jgi:hypothetical protein
LYEVFVEKTRVYERSVDDSIQHIADGIEMYGAFKAWVQSWNPVEVVEHLMDLVLLSQIIANDWEPIPEGE